MQKFYELLKESVIVQGIIALVVLCAIVYLYITTGNAPTELVSIFMVILGFYFGGKAQQYLNK